MEVNILILIGLIILAYIIGRWKGRKAKLGRSRSVLKGQVAEHFAPYLPNFPGRPSEAKFLGQPIDFIIFEGSDYDNITGVTFIEVKTGKSQLSQRERTLRNAIGAGKVKWKEWRI